MNKYDRGVLIGMALGDGYIKVKSDADRIKKRNPSAQMSFSHSIKQKEYAQYKVDRLNKIFGGNATLRTGVYKSTNGESYKICYANKSNPYFKVLRRMLYKNGQKYITRHVLNMLNPDGIAIWFMDDGSRRANKNLDGKISSVALTISTCCSREEVDSIIDYFNEIYGIGFKPALHKRTSLWSVRANTYDSKMLANLIMPYMIDSMKYKLSFVTKLREHELLKSNNQLYIVGL